MLQLCLLLTSLVLFSNCDTVRCILSKRAAKARDQLLEVTTISPDINKITPQVEELARNNAPILNLHPADQHHPSSVEWFLNRVELHYGKVSIGLDTSDTGPRIPLLSKGEVTAANLAAQTYNSFKSDDNNKPYFEKIPQEEKSQFFLDIPVEGEEATKAGNLAEAPCYCYIRQQDDNTWHFNYLFFYPYNADIVTSSDLPELNSTPVYVPFDLGSHEGDWEYFTVQYTTTTNTIEQVFYSAHEEEGKWYKQGDYPIHSVMRQPLVYVANKSHANYPTITAHKRKVQLCLEEVSFKLPPDETTGTGPKWNCKNKLEFLHITQPDWLNYNGKWGRLDDPDIIQFGKPPFGPATKGYW